MIGIRLKFFDRNQFFSFFVYVIGFARQFLYIQKKFRRDEMVIGGGGGVSQFLSAAARRKLTQKSAARRRKIGGAHLYLSFYTFI